MSCTLNLSDSETGFSYCQNTCMYLFEQIRQIYISTCKLNSSSIQLYRNDSVLPKMYAMSRNACHEKTFTAFVIKGKLTAFNFFV